jgi:hypothetical protein
MENLMIYSETDMVIADLANQLHLTKTEVVQYAISEYVKKIKADEFLINIQKKRVNNSWELLIRSLDKFSDDFMVLREQPLLEEREAF